MRKRRFQSVSLAATVFAAWAVPGGAQNVGRDLYFEPNAGQTDAQVSFIGRGSNCTLVLMPDGAFIRKGHSTIEMQFLGAATGVHPAGEDQLRGRVNYFIGDDASNWHSAVPTYSRVVYAGLYPGIDLSFYGNHSRLEYDFVVGPDSDPNAIRLSIGRSAVRVDARGDLVVTAEDGEFRWVKAVSYQQLAGVSGRKRYIESAYVVNTDHSVGFALGPYDHSRPLIIDPVITYSTYLGGSDDEGIFGIKFDGSGNLYVAGETSSINFPTRTPVQRQVGGDYDCFVSKFDHSGSTLIYSTYLGGSQYDHCTGLAVDWRGSAAVTGVSYSPDFPVRNALQRSLRGKSNAFVARLEPSGSELIFSTYLGGSGTDQASDIALDTAGNLCITGVTNSKNFPVTPDAYQSMCDRGAINGSCAFGDAFAAKISPLGRRLLYSTYVGGSAYDAANAIAVNRDGSIVITGETGSSDFPVQNPFQGSLAGPFNAFVTRLYTNGSGLVFSTYLGGNGYDAGTAVALDAASNVYVAGTTSSTSFPTTRPLQANNQGNGDGFVTKMDAAGSSLIYSTYLGGSGWDYPFRITVDGRGAVALVGFTASTDFPTVQPVQPAFGGGFTDAFVTLVNPAGSSLLYSTFLGGAGDDWGYAIYADAAGSVWAGGSTSSQNFPLVHAYQASYGGGPFDAFLTKISPREAAPLDVLPNH